jgi:hypothetical protein
VLGMTLLDAEAGSVGVRGSSPLSSTPSGLDICPGRFTVQGTVPAFDGNGRGSYLADVRDERLSHPWGMTTKPADPATIKGRSLGSSAIERTSS